MAADSSETWSGFLDALTSVGVDAAKKALGTTDEKVVPKLPAQAVTPTKETMPWYQRMEIVIPGAIGLAILGWLAFFKR